MPMKVTATDVVKTVVYHSPQTPGYTCWTGTWLMPDETLMVSFHQATGPFTNRPGAPPEILKRLLWPPKGRPAYDMTGTCQQIIHLASHDGGESWEQVAAEPSADKLRKQAEGENINVSFRSFSKLEVSGRCSQ